MGSVSDSVALDKENVKLLFNMALIVLEEKRFIRRFLLALAEAHFDPKNSPTDGMPTKLK